MLQRTQRGWKGDYEMSLKHNNIHHTATNTAVGRKKKWELDVISFCWEMEDFVPLSLRVQGHIYIKLCRYIIDGGENPDNHCYFTSEIGLLGGNNSLHVVGLVYMVSKIRWELCHSKKNQTKNKVNENVPSHCPQFVQHWSAKAAVPQYCFGPEGINRPGLFALRNNLNEQHSYDCKSLILQLTNTLDPLSEKHYI